MAVNGVKLQPPRRFMPEGRHDVIVPLFFTPQF